MTLILDMPDTLAGEADADVATDVAADVAAAVAPAETNGEAQHQAPSPPASNVPDLEAMGDAKYVATWDGGISEQQTTEVPAGGSPIIGVALEDSVVKTDENGKEYRAVTIQLGPPGEIVDAEYQVVDDANDATDPDERAAEEYLCNCQLRIAALKRQLKFAKAELNEATEALEGIRRRRERPAGGSEAGKSESAATENANGSTTDATADAASDPSATPQAPADPNAWITAPISVLNLKPKLAERLAENGIETIGQLENLRACGNAKGVGLRSIKGIGDAKVTEIEDAVIDWLSKNRDAAVLAEAKAVASGEPEATAEAATDATTAPADATATPQANSEPESASPAPPEDFKPDPQAIIVRAREINNGEDGCLDKKLKVDANGKKLSYYEDGSQAFKNQRPMTTCPWPAGGEQDDWLRGWAAEQLLSKYES